MMSSFKDKITERLFHGALTKYHGIENVVFRKLDYLNAAKSLDDLKIPPNNRLEKLKGDLKGFWSIRVNDQYRILFRWEKGNALEVHITDYH